MTANRRECDATAGGKCHAPATQVCENYGEGYTKYACDRHAAASDWSGSFVPLTDNVVVWVNLCSARRGISVTFEGPQAAAHAVAYLERLDYSDRAVEVVIDPTDEVTQWYLARFHPPCEHGMAGWLCAGPGHYPADY